MFEHKARVLLNLSQDAQRQATVNVIGSISGASKPVTDRLLLESAPTQARSLEGRPLAMYSSLMLPDRSRRRLLESWPRFAAAFGEQRRPISGLNECREQPDDVDRTGARNGLRSPEEIVTRFAEDGFEESRCAW
jgi:hypothetical protein